MRVDTGLQAPDEARRQYAVKYAAEHASDPNIDFHDVKKIPAVVPFHRKGDVVHADDFAALRIDDLLVEQIAPHPQHVFVGMVGRQPFIAETDSLKRDGLDLIVSNAKPSRARANQETVDSKGVDQRDKSRIAEPTDFTAFEVENFQAEDLGKVQDFFRHLGIRHPFDASPSLASTAQPTSITDGK
jgi:hypothetical protein